MLIQELNNLKNKIKELKKVKKSGTPTKISQSVRERDDKTRTFAPKDSKIDSSLKDFEIDSLPKFNEKSNTLKKLSEEYQNITEKNISNPDNDIESDFFSSGK